MIMTANGFIADINGRSISTSPDWEEFTESVRRYNNFVVGRKTFELVGEEGLIDSPCEHKVVVSSRKDITHNSSFTVVNSPLEAVQYLEDKKVDTLFLVGGSKLNTAFAKAGLIDEVTVIIQPSFLGRGTHLFSPASFGLGLQLADVDKLAEGRVKLKYLVNKEA